MCEYLGYQVLTLKRVRIMELTLDGLKEGAYREATRGEWEKLERGISGSSQQPAAMRSGKSVFSIPLIEVDQRLGGGRKEAAYFY